MIRQFVITTVVGAQSRWELPRKTSEELSQITNRVNGYNGRIVTMQGGPVRPFGPFGNVMQNYTITVEGDYDDPEYKKLYDHYNGTPTQSGTSTQTSSSGGCYIATAVYSSYDCPQVWTLRRYRDEELANSCLGRAFIRTYYAISPTIVKWFGGMKWFGDLWRSILDPMVKRLNKKGFENTPYQDRKW